MSNFRIGFGYDVHRLVEGRRLILGGVEIAHHHGLLGHSDADVLIHAVADALLGALALRDIGYHFPDNSDETLDMDSRVILREVVKKIREQGYDIGNIDATICAQQPRLSTYIPQMQAVLADCMGCQPAQVSIKATTTERLGFAGREEGIEAYAVALVCRSAE